MATESPLIHDGAQNVAGFDGRNSTQSGTTHLGPNGSPQFQFVRLSTVADRTVLLCTAAGQPTYGVLQNKPSTGEAADVGIFGISKVVAGATSFAAGGKIMADSSGGAIAYASAAGAAMAGVALTTPTAVGEIITAYIYGYGPGSIA